MDALDFRRTDGTRAFVFLTVSPLVGKGDDRGCLRGFPAGQYRVEFRAARGFTDSSTGGRGSLAAAGFPIIPSSSN